MNSQQENKLIKLLKGISWPKKLAGLAGIVGVGAVISIWALSPPHTKSASFNKDPHNHRGTTQSSLGTTTTPSGALTAPGVIPPLASPTLPQWSSTIPDTSQSSGALAAPSVMPPLSNSSLPQWSSTIPETTLPSRAATTPGTRTTPYSFTVPNRFSTTRNSTPSRSVPTPRSTTTPYSFTGLIRSSSTPSSTLSPQRFSTTPNITTTPRRSVPTPSITTTPRRFVPTPSITTTPRRSASTASSTTKPSRLPPSRVRLKGRTLIAANSSSVQRAKYPEQAIKDANAVAVGLVVAKHEGQIKPYTTRWRKAQDAISLLRRGKTRQEAAQRAGIPMSVLAQLIEWGQNRP